MVHYELCEQNLSSPYIYMNIGEELKTINKVMNMKHMTMNHTPE